MDALIITFLAVWLVSFACLFKLRPVAQIEPPRKRRTRSTLRLLRPESDSDSGTFRPAA